MAGALLTCKKGKKTQCKNITVNYSCYVLQTEVYIYIHTYFAHFRLYTVVQLEFATSEMLTKNFNCKVKIATP